MLGIRCLVVIVLLAGCSGEATTNDSAATSFVPTSSASTSSAAGVPGCVPDCNYGLTVPGDLAGEYQTEWFFGGGELHANFDGPWMSTGGQLRRVQRVPGVPPLRERLRGVFWFLTCTRSSPSNAWRTSRSRRKDGSSLHGVEP